MALQATVIWEVQKDGGGDNNGGGFDAVSGTPGTDKTFPTSSAVNRTDLVIDAAVNTDCTSPGTAFAASDVGNVINIISGTGFTVQRVQVMSVAGAVATCDKSLGTLGSTGGTGVLGGALASPGELGDALEDEAIGGMKAYIKTSATPYLLSTATANVTGGAFDMDAGNMVDIQLYIQGYDTDRAVVGSGDRPIIDANGNDPSVVFYLDGVFDKPSMLANIIIDGDSAASGGSATTRGVRSSSATNNTAFRVDVQNCAGTSSFSLMTAVECKASSGTGAGFSSCNVSSCWADDNGGDGFTLGNNAALTANDCIASNNTGDGFSGVRYAVLRGCTSYRNADGFIFTGSGGAVNCLAVRNSGYGFNALSTGDWLVNCASYENSSGRSDLTLQLDSNAIELTAEPFVEDGLPVADRVDFSLNTTAGGGADCRAAGISPAGQTGFLDVGAVQHEDAGGGGGGTKLVGFGGGMIG